MRPEAPWGDDCCRDQDGPWGREEHRRMWREHIRQFMEHSPEGHWFFGGRRSLAWWGGRHAGRVNPLVGLMLSRGGGILPLFVLHMLSRGPRYGNDVMRELERCSNGTWAGNPGAVYPLLRILEHEGLVSGQWEDATRRTRRVYRLTDIGRSECTRLKALMRPGLKEALDVMKGLFDKLYAEQQSEGTA